MVAGHWKDLQVRVATVTSKVIYLKKRKQGLLYCIISSSCGFQQSCSCSNGLNRFSLNHIMIIVGTYQ